VHGIEWSESLASRMRIPVLAARDGGLETREEKKRNIVYVRCTFFYSKISLKLWCSGLKHVSLTSALTDCNHSSCHLCNTGNHLRSHEKIQSQGQPREPHLQNRQTPPPLQMAMAAATPQILEYSPGGSGEWEYGESRDDCLDAD
jgi:hypothetical protein